MTLYKEYSSKSYAAASNYATTKKRADELLAEAKKKNKYDTGDDAALGFCTDYQGISQSENKEYGAIIFENDGTYYLSGTYVGNSKGVGWMGVDAIWYWGNPGMRELYGTVHTHPEELGNDGWSCRFSAGAPFCTQTFGDNWLPGVRYLGAPNGVLYKSVNGEENTIVYTGLSVDQSSIGVDEQKVYPNHQLDWALW